MAPAPKTSGQPTRVRSDDDSVMVLSCVKPSWCGSLRCLSTSVDLRFRYPYEEFMDHVRAMKTVRDWEYTQRFGHVGTSQDSRANSARVVEYFSDSYSDSKEAVRKAELFLSI